ncbi:MAG: GDP-mannose 4,6-dehydratase [Bacillota bacterium]
MRVLVTGATGFVGGHLVPALHKAGHAVITTGQAGTADYLVDLIDAAAVDQLIEQVRPQAVLHLAGVSSVSASWRMPADTLQTNIVGTVHLLEAVRTHVPAARFLSVGSAEEYGRADGVPPPWDEETPCRPLNPYGVSKLAQGQMVMQYHRRYGLDALHVRSFNHLGGGQGAGFVATDFASQIARMECGRIAPELRVGDLSARRDFLDVRDVVEAYLFLLDRGRTGEVYNVASGQGTSVQSLLETLLSVSGLSVTVSVDPDRIRPAEVPESIGSPARLMADTGWSPRHPLRDTLSWVLSDWRERVAAETNHE